MSQIANDWSPPVPKDLTVLEAAYRAIDWTTHRVSERSKLTPAQRKEKADEYEARAASWAAQAKDHPGLLELAGFCTTAARIMRAED